MKFEYDPAKSSINQMKHGIDFEEAQLLWCDENLLIFPLKYEAELRHACIGLLGDKHWTVIMTCRDNVIRLISVRRARKDEVAAYEDY